MNPPEQAPPLDARPTASDHEQRRLQILLSALRRGDLREAHRLAEVLLAADRSAPWLYEEILQPLLDSTGVAWEEGRTSVEEEHSLSAAITDLLARLAAPPPEHAASRGVVVLAAAPGERHQLGLAMVQDTLHRDGWTVSLPGELPYGELVRHCLRLDGDLTVVGISLHSATRRAALRAGIAELRAAVPRVPIVLGGLAVRQSPDLPADVGADGSATVCGVVDLVHRLTNPLTPREQEVLVRVAAGLNNAEIAGELGTAPSTVKTQLERIYLKCGRGDRAAAVAQALRSGWIR
jgi:DNA-binding CsgD family transcriptional regulator/methanogenic corrinoid protein MtbC1